MNLTHHAASHDPAATASPLQYVITNRYGEPGAEAEEIFFGAAMMKVGEVRETSLGWVAIEPAGDPNVYPSRALAALSLIELWLGEAALYGVS
ncbi:MAG TPA: hypothetical protein PLN64_01005 [Candidatus Bipolaricaulis anaerobius]|nr:hypothetical protein [Candidatus Bipolaricaulis anaerobius]